MPPPPPIWTNSQVSLLFAIGKLPLVQLCYFQLPEMQEIPQTIIVTVTADLSFGKLFTVSVVSDNFSRLRPEQLPDPAHRVNCGQ